MLRMNLHVTVPTSTSVQDAPCTCRQRPAVSVGTASTPARRAGMSTRRRWMRLFAAMRSAARGSHDAAAASQPTHSDDDACAGCTTGEDLQDIVQVTVERGCAAPREHQPHPQPTHRLPLVYRSASSAPLTARCGRRALSVSVATACPHGCSASRGSAQSVSAAAVSASRRLDSRDGGQLSGHDAFIRGRCAAAPVLVPRSAVCVASADGATGQPAGEAAELRRALAAQGVGLVPHAVADVAAGGFHWLAATDAGQVRARLAARGVSLTHLGPSRCTAGASGATASSACTRTTTGCRRSPLVRCRQRRGSGRPAAGPRWAPCCAACSCARRRCCATCTCRPAFSGPRPRCRRPSACEWRRVGTTAVRARAARPGAGGR